jgi:hypothetical protein
MRVPSSPRLNPPFDGGRTGRQFSGAIFGNTGTGSVSHHRGRYVAILVSSRGGGRWDRATHQRRAKIATESPRSLSPVSWPGAFWPFRATCALRRGGARMSYASYCQDQAADCARRAGLARSPEVAAYWRRLGLRWLGLSEQAQETGAILGNASDEGEVSRFHFSEAHLGTRNLACYLHLYFSYVKCGPPREVRMHPASESK